MAQRHSRNSLRDKSPINSKSQYSHLPVIDLVKHTFQLYGTYFPCWLILPFPYQNQALRFLGLLSGSCCKYMPILYADKASALTDLPITFPSLLSSTGWGVVAESTSSCLLRATERVRDWARNIKHGHCLPDSQPIDSAEEDGVIFLLRVMHETCVSVKEHLPLDKQLRLANMALDLWLGKRLEKLYADD